MSAYETCTDNTNGKLLLGSMVYENGQWFYYWAGAPVNNGWFTFEGETVSLEKLQEAYEGVLEPVYPCNIEQGGDVIEKISYTERNKARPKFRCNTPRVLIPVFPGTNCEYDSAKAVAKAGAVPEIFVINNLTAAGIAESAEKFAEAVSKSQAIFIPGGFSGGDEPDGSGKFITAFFRNETIKNAVHDLLKNRDGLMCGICNGFQALVKSGLLPYGRLGQVTKDSPTLFRNDINRHISQIVTTRVGTTNSPWLAGFAVGLVDKKNIIDGSKVKEGDVLIFEEEGRGYVKPVEPFVTIEEAIDDLTNIKDLG